MARRTCKGVSPGLRAGRCAFFTGTNLYTVLDF